jgi:hypothetical protein
MILQPALILGIALLCFIDDADQHQEVNVRQWPHWLDKV